MHHKHFLSIFFLLAVLLTGCAKQGMPTGGPKDVTPPVQKRTVPDNRTLSFADNQFYIEFDEYVVLKDADNNVLVSPPLKNKPEIKTKGRGVQVKIKDTLAENTTYLFQFKDAIADFNEGNLLPSLEYVFSTGSYIDSMTVRGRVVDAMTFEPREEAVSVWLMSLADAERFMATYGDSAATAPKLAYATRCNKDGSFVFNYMAPGKYRIFAVVDENKNQHIEPGESVAFAMGEVESKNMKDSVMVDSVLRSSADTEPVELLIFTPNADKQRVTGSDFTASGKVRLTTLLPMEAPVVDAGGEKVMWRLNARRDTLTLWTFREKCDSLRLVVSDKSGIADTLQLRWRPKKGKGTAMAQMQLGSGLEMNLNHKTLPFFDTLSLVFNTPLGGESGARDSLVQVKCLKDSSLMYCAVVVDSGLMKARIVYDFKQGEKYEVVVSKGCFKDIYGKGNDSLSVAVSVTKAEEYGNLTVEIRDTTLLLPPDYIAIVQLLDEKGTVVVSENAYTNVIKTFFPHLKPGKYRVRAIVDENRNGKWDTGNFAAGVQPERVVYLPKTLDIRANWDFEEKLELSK
jgi:uncharacterized protein (DUF2141 family)